MSRSTVLAVKTASGAALGKAWASSGSPARWLVAGLRGEGGFTAELGQHASITLEYRLES